MQGSTVFKESFHGKLIIMFEVCDLDIKGNLNIAKLKFIEVDFIL